MYCSKCGIQNTTGGRFCVKCGCLIENNNAQPETLASIDNSNLVNQSVNQVSSQQVNEQVVNNVQQTVQQPNQINNNMENIVNPDMKKYAILSVVVGAGGIVCAFVIGLSLLWAAVISSIGFNFAQKGKMADKKLSLIGNILNGIVLGYGILVFVFAILGLL